MKRDFMDGAKAKVNSRGQSSRLRVVVAYDDPAAGKRAIDVIANVGRRLGEEIEFEPLPWAFDCVADVDWCEVATSDAVNADVLIISCSRAGPLPPVIARWAERVICARKGMPTAIAALLCPEESPDETNSSRLEPLQAAASRSGLDFLAPMPRDQLDAAAASIHRRAELMTPVLDAILRRPMPGSRTNPVDQ
jgi:hypothetical protein